MKHCLQNLLVTTHDLTIYSADQKTLEVTKMYSKKQHEGPRDILDHFSYYYTSEHSYQ